MNIKSCCSICLITVSLILLQDVLFAQNKKHESYAEKIVGSDFKIDFVAIPAGQFNMGSPGNEAGHTSDEGPQHLVKIDAFWMSTHEITWDVYELFVYEELDETKSLNVDAIARPTKPYLDMTFGMGKEGYPAVGMTQYNALQFCKWLYSRTGIFYRLPTEAEWEYACRAGSITAYSYGDDPNDLTEYAWFAANSSEKTNIVGSKKPNKWGLYDMHGNVAEWTLDQYEPDFYKSFENLQADNPFAKSKKLYPHSVRGGSFEDDPEELRSADRSGSDPSWKQIDPQIPKSNWWFPEAPFIGIRLVRPLNPPDSQEIEIFYSQKPIADF